MSVEKMGDGTSKELLHSIRQYSKVMLNWRIGSIGKDLNTVYALAGNMLLRVPVEKGSLNIEKVIDLDDESIDVIPGVSEKTKSA